MNHQFYIYILTNNTGTLYIGVTNNLERRIYEHQNDLLEGFTKEYKLIKLIYFEEINNIETAIRREKQLKGWTRQKKLSLIRQMNSELDDLSHLVTGKILRQAQDDSQ